MTETVSPPERTTCVIPVRNGEGDWLPDGVSDDEMDSKGEVGDSEGSIKIAEGLSICKEGALVWETLLLARLLTEGASLSE